MEGKNHLVSKIENIETIFILFMTATPTATLDNKPVHLDSYSTEMHAFDTTDIQHATNSLLQSNICHTGKQMNINHLSKECGEKKGKSGNGHSKCCRILSLYLGPRRHFCRKWLMRLYVWRLADPLRPWSLSVYHCNKAKIQSSNQILGGGITISKTVCRRYFSPIWSIH